MRIRDGHIMNPHVQMDFSDHPLLWVSHRLLVEHGSNMDSIQSMVDDATALRITMHSDLQQAEKRVANDQLDQQTTSIGDI